MGRVKFGWTVRAKEDLRQLRRYIIRESGSPKTATAFIREIKLAAGQLRRMPQMGAPVPELDDPEILEIYHDSYRIIYRYRENRVAILAVFHGAWVAHLKHLSD
jgi:plasmid stabilization system protein ParE